MYIINSQLPFLNSAVMLQIKDFMIYHIFSLFSHIYLYPCIFPLFGPINHILPLCYTMILSGLISSIFTMYSYLDICQLIRRNQVICPLYITWRWNIYPIFARVVHIAILQQNTQIHVMFPGSCNIADIQLQVHLKFNQKCSFLLIYM